VQYYRILIVIEFRPKKNVELKFRLWWLFFYKMLRLINANHRIKIEPESLSSRSLVPRGRTNALSTLLDFAAQRAFRTQHTCFRWKKRSDRPVVYRCTYFYRTPLLLSLRQRVRWLGWGIYFYQFYSTLPASTSCTCVQHRCTRRRRTDVWQRFVDF
jgi:hypothetical protein